MPVKQEGLEQEYLKNQQSILSQLSGEENTSVCASTTFVEDI